MKPLIGITLHDEGEILSLNGAYAKCIAKAGGIPVLLPHGTVLAADEITRKIHGLFLTGGGDIDPIYFGEQPRPELGTIYPERDMWEMELCQSFLKANKPIFGICRGIQVLNVAAGGTLWQRIPSKEIKHFQEAPKNYATHSVKILNDCSLYKIMQAEKIRVNSYHHQSVNTIAPGFNDVCYSADGVIEAIESQEHKFAIGVQWHAEHLWEQPETKNLFKAFVFSCL